MVSLNLGCGNDIREGFVNCDNAVLPGVDVVMDLCKTFPFEDNSVDEVLFNNAIEHLVNPAFCVEEIWRVCKNNALVVVTAPHTANKVLDGKLWHLRSGINAYTFVSYEPGRRYNYYSKARFKIIETRYKLFFFKFLTGFLEKHKFFAEYLFARWFGIDSCTIKLKVIK